MSSDLFDVRVRSVDGCDVVLDVLTGPSNGSRDDLCSSRSFALGAISNALWGSAIRGRGLWDEAEVQRRIRASDGAPLTLALAGEGDWYVSEAWMRANVGRFITECRLLERRNDLGEAELDDRLLAIEQEFGGALYTNKQHLWSPRLWERCHNYTLQVRLTDPRWGAHLSPGLEFGTTAFDVWYEGRAVIAAGSADGTRGAVSPPNDEPAIEAEDGHRLTLWRRFGSAALKGGARGLRLLGWDPSGTILHVQETSRPAPARIEHWNVRTGERLPPTSPGSDTSFAIDAPCSLVIEHVEGSGQQVPEVWDLRAGALLTTLARTKMSTCAFTTSADGRLLLHWRQGGESWPHLTVHALPGGEVVGERDVHWPVAASPDGSLVASMALTSCRMEVTRPDGTPVATLGPETINAVEVVFGRDGRRLFVAHHDGEVSCWELATGERLWRARPYGDDAPVRFVAVARSADGETFFALDARDRLCAISAAGEVRWRANPPKVESLSWAQLLPSPDGSSVAVGSTYHLRRIVNAATGADRTPGEGHQSTLRSLALSSDGRFAASGDERGEVRVYDLASGETQWVLEGAGMMSGLEFTRDGRSLWTATYDGDVRRWNLATGFEEEQRKLPSPGHELPLVAARDGARILATSRCQLELWSDETAEPVRWSRRIGDPGQFEAAFSDAESQIVLATFHDRNSDPWSLSALDAATGEAIGEPVEMPGRLLALRSTDDGPLSVSYADNRVVVREACGGRREVAACEASYALTQVAVSADGRWMALADRKRVEVWSLAPSALYVGKLRPVDENDSVARLALSHDGGLVVVGTACGVVAVYARTENAAAQL